MTAGVPVDVGAPEPLRHRRSARALTAGQLADLRQAVQAAQAISDDRGYQSWAGIHGLPLPISCTHHTPLFLPWHRAYLYFFEKALQDVVAGVTVAWWDWTATDRTIPAAFADTTLADGSANPLASSPIQPSGRRNPRERSTTRRPGRGGRLPTPADVANVLG